MPLLHRCRRWLSGLVARGRQVRGTCLWARPATAHLAGTGTALARTRGQLLAENALLRQHVLGLRRGVTRPAVAPADRVLLVLLAGRVRAWRQALLLVQPETLLRWYRAGFRSGTVKLSLLGGDGDPKVGNDRRIRDRIQLVPALTTARTGPAWGDFVQSKLNVTVPSAGRRARALPAPPPGR